MQVATKGRLPRRGLGKKNKGVPESLLYTYENSLWTDVTLECTAENGDTQFIKAHKHVLASRSTVFEAILFGEAADKGDIVKITTFRYELMYLLIRYLYSEQAHFTEGTARLMFEIASFYQAPALVNLCSQYLQSIAREDNVCEILDLALQYDNVGLREAACDYIDQNAPIVIETDGFVQVSQMCLEYILKSDTFHVYEKTILRRTIEWAKLHQDNMDEDIRFNITVKHFRNTIGNAFQHTRLGAMSFAEFSECAGSTLNAEEIKDILLFTNNCSTDEFHHKRSPKKEILELKNGTTSWTASLKCRSSESKYQITVKKDIICEGINFSKLSLLATFGNSNFGEPNLDFSVNITIKITRTGLNYSFNTAMQNVSSHTINFDSPVDLQASEDPYTLVVKIEFQPKPLSITISANQSEVGSATVEHAEVKWNNQFSILQQIQFSNMSNREFKGKERDFGDAKSDNFG